MTKFLDVHAVSQLVQTIGVKTAIKEMAAYILDDYRRWHEFTKCPRIASHYERGVIELMPAADRTLYAFKYVNGHPKNFEHHMPTVFAFGVLSETETGYPVFLSELTLATALRTAATSATVAKFMARSDSRSMAVIGCGAQSEFQILAFHALLGITDFYVYDIDAAAIKKLCDNLVHEKITLTPAASVTEAVQQADIVTTITADKTKATILTPDMTKPGLHINGVGGDCPGKTELHKDILAHARVVVEYEPQSRIEGDVQQMPADFPVTEFWEIAQGRKPGRNSDAEITVFDSVGFAIEDFSALRYFRDKAAALNLGTTIDLVPTLPDPKDLYALTRVVPMPILMKAAAQAEAVVLQKEASEEKSV